MPVMRFLNAESRAPRGPLHNQPAHHQYIVVLRMKSEAMTINVLGIGDSHQEQMKKSDESET
jgi:hypothetical protein